jgi:hypothetical protein
MRYLSKIIFIESANIKYSEVNVDGNVHFIGTQGVGKSTLLRALLFFYNANQQKLGIPVGKKSFLDFYFPYQNSYIVYEVNRETGMFCVLVFKSQGRVCFRFIDGNYNRNHFIDSEGSIHETWDKIKVAFGNGTYYTRKIDRYEDYRNILYGNSQGLGSEFKKYALLESKQYQNIPRAIQHVFLNYKVESEFIKDTIIKSLNEEEINIDLSNYSSHLKNFDTQLSDIKKWTEKTKSGEIIVRKQAETVITTYSSIKFNDSEKRQLAGELVWQLNEIEKQQPKVADKFGKEETKQNLLAEKFADLERKFQRKKEKISAEIIGFDNKLKEAKTKSDEYVELKIESVIKRVSKKSDWELEKEELTKQKELLESNFADIKQKFEAQITQRTNQLSTFENLKQNEINTANKDLLHFKEELTKEYEKLFEEIKKQHLEELQLAKNLVEEKKTAINKLELAKAETKHKRFYETEIENLKTDISGLTEKIRIANSETKQLNDEIETIKKQWELEKEKIETTSNNQKEKVNEQIGKLNDKIKVINEKIENSKDSLYGWLNKEYPNWEKTIGKVIDEENILFKSGLSPEQISKTDLSFYGIKIDLNEITKSVKTVADYEQEKIEFAKKIELFQKEISAIAEQLNVDLENLRKKQQPKINKCKETIRSNGYTIEQNAVKLEEAKVSAEEFAKKAADDKKVELAKIQSNFERTSSEKLNADKVVKEVEDGIKKQIDSKRKEKDKKIDAEQKKISDSIAEINLSVKNRKEETKKKIDELKTQQKKELDSKGADTEKIAKLTSRIDELKTELDFIEKNNPITERYKYDKEQLFDKVEFFKNQKAGFENQLGTEQTKHNLQKQKLIDEINLLKAEIEIIKQLLSNIQEDLTEYEAFKITDCFKSIPELSNEPVSENKNEKRCKFLIAELNEKYYTGIKKYTDLQEAINKFNGNFSTQNIFKFKTNLIEQADYFQFSEDLQEFVEEDKIALFEKRVNELFADIIKQVGKETTELLSKEGEIETVIRDINSDFVKRIFTGVIKSIELRVVGSENKIVHLLTEIKKFNDENINEIGVSNLFSTSEQTREAKNKKAIGLLTQLIKEISDYKHKDINLSDSFELEFKVVENDNDTNWVQSLSNVGSNGTDVLVKAMINIMLLNVFKEGATKNRFKDFRLHCMVDEIGTLHIENVRGLLKFANDRNIYLINSSPQSLDALAYRHTYKLAKQVDSRDGKPVTIINRLITNNREQQ